MNQPRLLKLLQAAQDLQLGRSAFVNVQDATEGEALGFVQIVSGHAGVLLTPKGKAELERLRHVNEPSSAASVG